MKYRNIFLVFLGLISLIACSNQPDKLPVMNGILLTDIGSNDLKLFTYKVTMSAPPRSKGAKAEGRGGEKRGNRTRGSGGRGHEGVTEAQKEHIYALLDAKLTETGYCREGYINIGSYFEKIQAELRGECNEGATLEDRETFTANKNIAIEKDPGQFSDILALPTQPE
ncbi:MAG: hypothetical protein QNK32_07470 [Porticoccus sp.]|nr:hypothetical protein [Porticoccus sp.]